MHTLTTVTTLKTLKKTRKASPRWTRRCRRWCQSSARRRSHETSSYERGKTLNVHLKSLNDLKSPCLHAKSFSFKNVTSSVLGNLEASEELLLLRDGPQISSHFCRHVIIALGPRVVLELLLQGLQDSKDSKDSKGLRLLSSPVRHHRRPRSPA